MTPTHFKLRSLGSWGVGLYTCCGNVSSDSKRACVCQISFTWDGGNKIHGANPVWITTEKQKRERDIRTAAGWVDTYVEFLRLLECVITAAAWKRGQSICWIHCGGGLFRETWRWSGKTSASVFSYPSLSVCNCCPICVTHSWKKHFNMIVCNKGWKPLGCKTKIKSKADTEKLSVIAACLHRFCPTWTSKTKNIV